jgi:hypothetical protein
MRRVFHLQGASKLSLTNSVFSKLATSVENLGDIYNRTLFYIENTINPSTIFNITFKDTSMSRQGFFYIQSSPTQSLVDVQANPLDYSASFRDILFVNSTVLNSQFFTSYSPIIYESINFMSCSISGTLFDIYGEYS